MTEPGPRRIEIAASKFDGSLHYRYEAEVLREERSGLCVLQRPGTPWRGDRGRGTLRYEATTLYFYDRWYNVTRFREPAGRRGMVVYVDIGTPAALGDGVLRWIHLDLEVILDARGVRVDDEEQFEVNRHRLAYPSDLVSQALMARDEVLARLHVGTLPVGPFPGEQERGLSPRLPRLPWPRR